MSPSKATSFPLEEMGEAITDDAQVTHSLLDPASLMTTDTAKLPEGRGPELLKHHH